MIPSARVLRELLGDTELHSEASPALTEAFVAVRHALAKAEQATAKRDGIEADLLTRLGYPRVWVADGTLVPPGYVTKSIELDQLIAEDRINDHLGQQLRDELQLRQTEWREAATEAGLPAAIQSEDAAAAFLFQLTNAFFDQPITTSVDVPLYVAMLIACGEPGPSEAEIFPWRELRKLFTALSEL